MKKVFFAAFMLFLVSSCANRLGDLSMLSNRNYDRSQEYVLLQRDVKAKVKTKKNDIIERIVDKATSSVNGGEYVANATLWVSASGKKMKITGDVWGIKPVEVVKPTNTTVNVTTSVTKVNEFFINDTVSFKSHAQLVQGKIIGINSNGAIVEFVNPLKKVVNKEIAFDKLTKIGE